MLFGISVSIRLYILLFCVLTWISCVSYYCQLIKIQGSEWSTLNSRSMFFSDQSDHLMIGGPVWSLLHSIQKIASFIQILGGNHDYRDLKDFPQILRLHVFQRILEATWVCPTTEGKEYRKVLCRSPRSSLEAQTCYGDFTGMYSPDQTAANGSRLSRASFQNSF